MRLAIPLAGLLLTACDLKEPLPFEPASPQAAPDPAEMGPYPVGVRTVVFEDPNRETPGREGQPRRLVCEVWYPAVEATRGQPTETYVLYDHLPESLRDGLTPEALGELATAAVRDAQPRANEQFPTIIFSHGKGGVRQQSTFYTVALASHGYVVVAPDHEGDTMVELLEAGDVDVTSTIDSYFLRPGDVSFLIRELDALDESDPLQPLIDTSVVGVTGHSFGALTSFRSAGSDARVTAIVGQTPAGVGLVEAGLEVQVEDFGIPYMIQAGGKDRTLPKEDHADTLWDDMVAPRYYLNLRSAGHFTYSDLCILDVEAIDEALDVDASNVLTDGCGEENLSSERAFPVINHYSVGFFNAYLRGSTDSLELLTEARGKAHAGDDVEFIAERE
jgi:predicted dienelactone hydrolase